jgi:hypothetical protein
VSSWALDEHMHLLLQDLNSMPQLIQALLPSAKSSHDQEAESALSTLVALVTLSQPVVDVDQMCEIVKECAPNLDNQRVTDPQPPMHFA